MQDLLKDPFFIKMVNNPDSEAKHYWQIWLEQHPDRKKDFDYAKQIVRSIKYKETKNLSDADYDKVFIQIMDFKKKSDEKGYKFLVTKKKSNYEIFKVAAAILFLITVSFSFYYLFPENGNDSVTYGEEYIYKKVPFGAKNTIKLTDGTKIILNAGSQLVFPKQFKGNVRTVELKGEAFFDVAKDGRPFIIKTGKISTSVLGTTFNLRAYEKEKIVEIALITGKVKINDMEGFEMLLEPSEMAVFSKETNAFDRKGFDERLVTSWKDNILVFEKATIKQIKEKLEQWYGVDVKIELNGPLNGLYTGEHKNESLEVVLDGIGFTSGFHYKIDNKSLTIKN